MDPIQQGGVPPYQPPTGQFQPGASAFGSEPIKKKHTGRKILAGVLGVVVLLGVGGGIAYAASDVVKNFARANFTSDKSYFDWVIEKNTTQEAQALRSAYDRYLGLMDSGTTQIGVSAELSDTSRELLAKELEGTELEGLELNSAEISGKLFHVDDNVGLRATLLANDTNLLEVNGAADLEEGMAYFQIPTFSDSYVSMDFSEDLQELTDELADDLDLYVEDDFSLESLLSGNSLRDVLSPEELEDLYVRYITAMTGELDDVQVNTREKVEVGGLEFSTTEIELDLDQDNLADALKAVFQEAKHDDVIQRIASDYFGVSESDYTDAVDELIDSMDEAGSGEFDCTCKLYVSADGSLCGLKLEVPDELEVFSFMGLSKKNAGIACNLSVDGEELLDVSLELDRDGDVYSGSGEATVSVDDTIYTASVDLDDFEVVDKELLYCKGDLSISISDLVEDFTIHLDSDGSAQTISADVVYEGENYGTVSLTYGMSEATSEDLPFPEDGDTVYDGTNNEDEQAYGAEIDVESYYELIEDTLKIDDAEALLQDVFAELEPVDNYDYEYEGTDDSGLIDYGDGYYYDEDSGQYYYYDETDGSWYYYDEDDESWYYYFSEDDSDSSGNASELSLKTNTIV